MKQRVHNKYHKTAPEDAVYIGRGSPWGNPYSSNLNSKACYLVSSRTEAIRLFERNVLPTLDLEPLRGKDLVCFCKPKPCHGDAILKALEADEFINQFL